MVRVSLQESRGKILKVVKFGGSSVATGECFETVKNDVALQNKKLNVAYVESRAQALLVAIENALKNEGEVILMLGKGEEALNRGAQGYTQCESDLDIAKRMILCYDLRDNKQI
jgi:aspartokinase